jgi:hypothetical protein
VVSVIAFKSPLTTTLSPVMTRAQWEIIVRSRIFAFMTSSIIGCPRCHSSLGARVPGFEWEHDEHIAGIETLCPAFTQQEHPVHIWNVIWTCAPNVPIGNISFAAEMRPCHVSEMYPPGTFQMLSTHVHKMFPAYAQWACCGYMHFV